MEALSRAVRLYWELRGLQVWIRLEGVVLDVRGPARAMTRALHQRLVAAKNDLLRLLAEPCPCRACAGDAEASPIPRLCCASGQDTDATWEALRREFDALDEADERAAIQAEIAASPAELHAEKSS